MRRRQRFTAPARRALAAAGALVLAALLFAGCEGGARGHLDAAEDLAFHGKHEKAFAEVKAALDALGNRTDDESRALRVRALALGGRLEELYLGKPKEALSYYRTLVELSPSSEQAYDARERMARIHVEELDDLPGAIAHYQAIVEGFPDRPGVDKDQYEIVRGYLALGAYDQARTEARRLAEKWPKSEYLDDARFLVASAWQAQGQQEKALEVYREIWRTWPDSPLAPRARLEAGNCLVDLGREQEALEMYVAALKDHPDPKIVQLKIQRLRARIRERRPKVVPRNGPLNRAASVH